MEIEYTTRAARLVAAPEAKGQVAVAADASEIARLAPDGEGAIQSLQPSQLRSLTVCRSSQSGDPAPTREASEPRSPVARISIATGSSATLLKLIDSRHSRSSIKSPRTTTCRYVDVVQSLEKAYRRCFAENFFRAK
ncbi:hypothetical protein HAX54_006748, partial [Datura stramonium]|nr:hypothetical protein [Datura stramonium]